MTFTRNAEVNHLVGQLLMTDDPSSRTSVQVDALLRHRPPEKTREILFNASQINGLKLTHIDGSDIPIDASVRTRLLALKPFLNHCQNLAGPCVIVPICIQSLTRVAFESYIDDTFDIDNPTVYDEREARQNYLALRAIGMDAIPFQDTSVPTPANNNNNTTAAAAATPTAAQLTRPAMENVRVKRHPDGYDELKDSADIVSNSGVDDISSCLRDNFGESLTTIGIESEEDKIDKGGNCISSEDATTKPTVHHPTQTKLMDDFIAGGFFELLSDSGKALIKDLTDTDLHIIAQLCVQEHFSSNSDDNGAEIYQDHANASTSIADDKDAGKLTPPTCNGGDVEFDAYVDPLCDPPPSDDDSTDYLLSADHAPPSVDDDADLSNLPPTTIHHMLSTHKARMDKVLQDFDTGYVRAHDGVRFANATDQLHAPNIDIKYEVAVEQANCGYESHDDEPFDCGDYSATSICHTRHVNVTVRGDAPNSTDDAVEFHQYPLFNDGATRFTLIDDRRLHADVGCNGDVAGGDVRHMDDGRSSQEPDDFSVTNDVGVRSVAHELSALDVELDSAIEELRTLTEYEYKYESATDDATIADVSTRSSMSGTNAHDVKCVHGHAVPTRHIYHSNICVPVHLDTVHLNPHAAFCTDTSCITRGIATMIAKLAFAAQSIQFDRGTSDANMGRLLHYPNDQTFLTDYIVTWTYIMPERVIIGIALPRLYQQDDVDPTQSSRRHLSQALVKSFECVAWGEIMLVQSYLGRRLTYIGMHGSDVQIKLGDDNRHDANPHNFDYYYGVDPCTDDQFIRTSDVQVFVGTYYINGRECNHIASVGNWGENGIIVGLDLHFIADALHCRHVNVERLYDDRIVDLRVGTFNSLVEMHHSHTSMKRCHYVDMLGGEPTQCSEISIIANNRPICPEGNQSFAVFKGIDLNYNKHVFPDITEDDNVRPPAEPPPKSNLRLRCVQPGNEAEYHPPSIDPSERAGKRYLKAGEKNGERYRAKILECIGEFEGNLKTNPERVKFRTKFGGDLFEDIVEYSDVLNFIEKQEEWDDGIWNFRDIIGHEDEKLLKIVLIEWEYGERSWELASEAYKLGRYELAKYCKENGLLDEWTTSRMNLGNVASQEKKLLRALKQGKLRSYQTVPVYQLVPRKHQQAVEIDKKNGYTKWQDSERLGDSVIHFECNGVRPYYDNGYKHTTTTLKLIMTYRVKRRVYCMITAKENGEPFDYSYSADEDLTYGNHDLKAIRSDNKYSCDTDAGYEYDPTGKIHSKLVREEASRIASLRKSYIHLCRRRTLLNRMQENESSLPSIHLLRLFFMIGRLVPRSPWVRQDFGTFGKWIDNVKVASLWGAVHDDKDDICLTFPDTICLGNKGMIIVDSTMGEEREITSATLHTSLPCSTVYSGSQTRMPILTLLSIRYRYVNVRLMVCPTQMFFGGMQEISDWLVSILFSLGPFLCASLGWFNDHMELAMTSIDRGVLDSGTRELYVQYCTTGMYIYAIWKSVRYLGGISNT